MRERITDCILAEQIFRLVLTSFIMGGGETCFPTSRFNTCIIRDKDQNEEARVDHDQLEDKRREEGRGLERSTGTRTTEAFCSGAASGTIAQREEKSGGRGRLFHGQTTNEDVYSDKS